MNRGYSTLTKMDRKIKELQVFREILELIDRKRRFKDLHHEVEGGH